MTRFTLFRVLLASLFVLLSVPGVVAAQTGTPTASPLAEDGIYRDPAGRYTVPVPTNWTADEHGDVVVLAAPDDTLRIMIVVVEAESAGAAIDLAWEMAAPERDRSPSPEIVQSPSGPGIDETLVVTDDYGETSGEIRQAIAIRIGTVNYVLIADGSLEVAIQRASQTQIILSGFTVLSLEATPVARGDLLPFDDALAGQFDGYIAELLERLEVPGASVAVVVDGEIVYARGYGVTERGGSTPIGPDTYMMIGSTTKSMTTTMMASAIDDGVFDWDTPARDLYPTFAMADPDLSETVTMRNLVCACTGVPRQDLEFALNGQATAEKVVASLAGFEVYTEFGEAFQYSNQMVAAAGYIGAGADNPGQPLTPAYLASMQERVFDPIGMNRTTFDFAAVAADPDHAMPHGASLFEDYVPIPIAYEAPLLPIAPAGAAWSTANDMAAYLITQMQRGMAPDGTQVVSAENLTETWQPQVQVDATTSYGLGWLIGESYGQPVISHDGNTFGFTAKLAFLPESQVGVVVLANAQAANLFTEGVVARLAELVNGEEATFDAGIVSQLEIAETQLASILPQIGDRPNVADVSDLLGTYASETLGTLTLTIDDRGALMVSTGEFDMEVRPVVGGPVRALAIIDPPLALTAIEIRETENGIELVLVEGIDERVFVKTADAATPVAGP